MSIENDAPVFLFACGRSGSTLVQRLLNTNENLHIWGEHGGALTPLAHSYGELTNPDNRCLIAETTSGSHDAVMSSLPVVDHGNWSVHWYNRFGEIDVRYAYRGLIERLFTSQLKPSAQHWGFKEIRYGLTEARFLSTLFPKAKFLLLVRDPVDVVRSQLEFFYLDEMRSEGGFDKWSLASYADKALASIIRIHEIVGSELSESCHLDRYEDILENPLERLSTISGFLGASEFVEEKVTAILGEEKMPRQAGTEGEDIARWIHERLDDGSEIGARIAGLRAALSYDMAVENP